MEEQDLKNLEVLFAIARKELALDENQLIEIISLKKRLFDILEVEKEEDNNIE